jgi:hypothetical protein
MRTIDQNYFTLIILPQQGFILAAWLSWLLSKSTDDLGIIEQTWIGVTE